MARCPLYESCAFLKDETFEKMRGLVHRFQQIYCQGNYSGCARYKIASALGESFVPTLMMPNQIEWADQVLLDQQSA